MAIFKVLRIFIYLIILPNYNIFHTIVKKICQKSLPAGQIFLNLFIYRKQKTEKLAFRGFSVYLIGNRPEDEN